MVTFTITARPFSCFKVCDIAQFRIGQGTTRRTDLSSETHMVGVIQDSGHCRLSAEQGPNGRPSCLRSQFSHADLGESAGLCIARNDVIKHAHNARRKLMAHIIPVLGNRGEQNCNVPFFRGVLRYSQRPFDHATASLESDFLTVRQRREILTTQVKADAAHHLMRRTNLTMHCSDDTFQPVALPVSCRLAAITDFPRGQGVTVQTSGSGVGKANCNAFLLETASLKWHPADKCEAAALAMKRGAVFGHAIRRRVHRHHGRSCKVTTILCWCQ